MALQDRVADLSGVSVSTSDANQWIADGTRDLINVLPAPALSMVSEVKTDSGSGVEIESPKVLGATKAGRPAREVPANAKASLTDAGSLHQATDFSPAFYREAGKVYVVPGGGEVYVPKFPSVDASADAIDGFPDELEHLAVVYAAAQAVRTEIADTHSSLTISKTDLDTRIDDDDSEMAGVELQKLQQILQEETETIAALQKQLQALNQQYTSGVKAFLGLQDQPE